MRPGLDDSELMMWAMEVSGEPFDAAALVAALPEPQERFDALRFAARMAWKDGDVAAEERRDLNALAHALKLPSGAVGRVLRDPHCTYRDADLFYSYRRDRVSGRMAAMIWID